MNILLIHPKSSIDIQFEIHIVVEICNKKRKCGVIGSVFLPLSVFLRGGHPYQFLRLGGVTLITFWAKKIFENGAEGGDFENFCGFFKVAQKCNKTDFGDRFPKFSEIFLTFFRKKVRKK